MSDLVSPTTRFTALMFFRWSAVVCGAVLRGLEGSIVHKKKCRRHYGHGLSNVYDPILHSGYDTTKRHVWTHFKTGRKRLSGFMRWQIGKVCTNPKTFCILSWMVHVLISHPRATRLTKTRKSIQFSLYLEPAASPTAAYINCIPAAWTMPQRQSRMIVSTSGPDLPITS